MPRRKANRGVAERQKLAIREIKAEATERQALQLNAGKPAKASAADSRKKKEANRRLRNSRNKPADDCATAPVAPLSPAASGSNGSAAERRKPETPSQWLHGFSDTVMSMAIEAGICEEAWDSEDDECGPMSAPAIARTSGHGADGGEIIPYWSPVDFRRLCVEAMGSASSFLVFHSIALQAPLHYHLHANISLTIGNVTIVEMESHFNAVKTPYTVASACVETTPVAPTDVDSASLTLNTTRNEGWAVIPYCSPADFFSTFMETNLAVQEPAASQAWRAAASQSGTPSVDARSGIPVDAKMMFCYKSLPDMTLPCLSTAGQPWALIAYRPASTLHNFKNSLLSSSRPLRPPVDMRPTKSAVPAVPLKHGNNGAAAEPQDYSTHGGNASQGRDSNGVVTATEASLPDDEALAAFRRLQPPSQAPPTTGVTTEIGIDTDFDFSNLNVDISTAIAVATVSDLLSPVATAMAMAATVKTTIMKPSPNRTLIGKTWDKATKLAVLPVVFFRHQSCKPAPEPIAETDTVPTSDSTPTSPEAAAVAVSKPASLPYPDLAKMVVSYKMLDIHCCSCTSCSCKARLRLGIA